MLKSITRMIAAVAVVALLVSGAQAARVGLWDAKFPGSSPATTWEDQSSTGYDLDVFDRPGGGGLPVHNDPGDYYDIDKNNGFVGTGASSVYDFDHGNTGGTSADPFSINIYLKETSWDFGASNYAIVSKATEPGDGKSQGYILQFNPDSNARIDAQMQPANVAGTRLFDRVEDIASLVDRDIMLTVTFDGSGTPAGTKQYINGVELTATYNEDNLVGSIKNSGVLRLGYTDAGGGPTDQGIDANVYFFEIYDEELSLNGIQARWNGGNPERIPEPSTLLLLATGLVGLLGFRGRRQGRSA